MDEVRSGARGIGAVTPPGSPVEVEALVDRALETLRLQLADASVGGRRMDLVEFCP